MASQSLLSAVSADGAGLGATVTGPSTINVSNASVFDGARVLIETSVADTAANYAPAKDGDDEQLQFNSAGAATLNMFGAYYVRAVVENAGPNTSLTVTLDK